MGGHLFAEVMIPLQILIVAPFSGEPPPFVIYEAGNLPARSFDLLVTGL
jgi:hypothetical protein